MSHFPAHGETMLITFAQTADPLLTVSDFDIIINNCSITKGYVRYISMIKEVLLKKAKRLGPVIVEGKLLTRIKINAKRIPRTIEQELGNQSRRIMFPMVEIKPNQVFFMTFQHQFTCNPKYITYDLLKSDKDVEIYFAVGNINAVPYELLNNEHLHFVKQNSYEYFEALASSKVIVTNSILGDKAYPFPKKKGQIVIETWHGSLGIKRFDPEHYKSSASWPEAMKRTGKLTDICLSNSTFENMVFTDTYWQNSRILTIGHARNDVFFPSYEEQRAKWKDNFCKQYNVDENAKLAIYGPTFRDDHNFQVYDMNYEEVLAALRDRFGGDWKLLLRFHPTVSKESKKKYHDTEDENIINVTDYPDIQELLAISDVGITDYSSWIFDFVLSRKPAFLYANDMALYTEERSFYYPLSSTPFPIALNMSEMLNNIRNFDEKAYAEKVEEFLEDKGCIDDGHAGERAAELICGYLK